MLNPPTIHSENRIADSYHSHALCGQSMESVTGFSIGRSGFLTYLSLPPLALEHP
jgi:hypothetical protein